MAKIGIMVIAVVHEVFFVLARGLIIVRLLIVGANKAKNNESCKNVGLFVAMGKNDGDDLVKTVQEEK